MAALLKADHSHLIAFHCLAHRLELGFKDAVKKTSQKVYDRAMTLLLGLYYLYRRSPTQKRALKNSYESLNLTVILPTRVGGTRWLPRVQRSITAFFKGYRAIRQQLESSSHTNPKAEGYAKLAADGHVIVYLLKLQVFIIP